MRLDLVVVPVVISILLLLNLDLPTNASTTDDLSCCFFDIAGFILFLFVATAIEIIACLRFTRSVPHSLRQIN